METFNWVYSIPLAGILGGITVAMYAIYLKNKRGSEESGGAAEAARAAAQDSAAATRHMLEKLDAIDARLAAVEKSLRDNAGAAATHGNA
jgi:hypothetical protein